MVLAETRQHEDERFGDAGVGSSGTIVANGVSKVYHSRSGEPTEALRDVSFAAAQGEVVAVVGPSGCGKTTLLRICAGLIPPSMGHVDVDGTGEAATPGSYGFVFQSPALLPWRTVAANILLPAQILGLPKRAAADRMAELLELVRLSGLEDRYPGELSGGMQQRVSLARALLHDPAMLLMDEPFGALDAITRQQMNNELQKIHLDQGKTVLLITHNISEAIYLADKVLVMAGRPGRIVSSFAVDFERPREYSVSATEEFRRIELQIQEALL